MRGGRGVASGKFRRVRIVAVHALLALGWAQVLIPKAADASMRSGFPIPIRRAVTTTAQLRAVGEFQLVAIAGLQEFKVRFVMAVEAVVVAAMTAVAHDDVRMFFGNDKILICVVTKLRRFAFFVAD